MPISKKNAPRDFIIDDSTDNDLIYSPTINNEPKGHGLVNRDLRTFPPQMFAPPDQMKLIPPSEWDARIDMQEETESSLEHIRLSGGPNGGMMPSLDQNGQGYCLVPGTFVHMADGLKRPIEQIHLGETVRTAEGNAGRVMQCHARWHEGSILTVRTFGDVPLRLTPNHEVLTGRGYIPAGKLTTTDIVADVQRRWFPVRSVERQQYTGEVFNIGVEGDNSYVAEGVGVHNCWAYSTTMCVMLLRAIMAVPYVRLSGHAVGCTVKNYRDEGGWCGLSAKFHKERGCPSVDFWKEKSMSKANDTPATWENAAKHKVTEDWIDVARPVYDANLTTQQLATCLLLNIPCAVDYDEWGHSICAIRWCRIEAGLYVPKIINSWSDQWGDRGMGLINKKWTVDSSVALRVTGASPT